MKRLLAASVLAVLLLAAPAGAQEPLIRPGVSAGGVDLSNLTVAQADFKLQVLLAPRYQADLVIAVAGRPWTLKMKKAKLRFDPVRTAKRALYSQPPVTTVLPKVSHAHLVVKAFVESVAAKVNRAARDARIRIPLRHIFRTHSRPGHVLAIGAMRRLIDAAIDDPATPRALHKTLTPVAPNVTAKRLARVYPT